MMRLSNTVGFFYSVDPWSCRPIRRGQTPFLTRIIQTCWSFVILREKNAR